MSGARGSLSLFERGEAGVSLIAAQEILGEMKHSEGFFDALHSLVSSQGLSAADIEAWWTNQGPGSFTGLRIGLAAIKGICLATGAKLVMVDGAEARAQAWLKESKLAESGTLIVCTYSTVKKSISHRYEWDGQTLSQPTITFIEQIPESTPTTHVLTDKNELSADYFPAKSHHLIHATQQTTLITAAEIAAATPIYFATHEYTKQTTQTSAAVV